MEPQTTERDSELRPSCRFLGFQSNSGRDVSQVVSFGRNLRSFNDSIDRRFVRSLFPGDFILTTPQFLYSLFGLQIHSNLSIPEISAVQISPPGFSAADSSPQTNRIVEIHLGVSPYQFESVSRAIEELTYASDYKDNVGEPALRIWRVNGSQFLRLDYFDGTRFWLDREGTDVWATWPDNLTVEDTATYLLGPVLGLLLRLRGVTCLHASAVSFDNCAVAFVGSEGAGKSTTAAALAQQGCRELSDDIVALDEMDGSFYVHPAYPYLCLWPESVQSIYGSAEALPRFSRNYEKRCLSLGRQKLQFESRSLPLKAIYVLGERRFDPAPAIESMSAQKSLLALVANTFATNVLDPAMRGEEFAALGRLIPCIRVREVFAHTDPARLPELCRLIREDVETDKYRKLGGGPKPAQ